MTTPPPATGAPPGPDRWGLKAIHDQLQDLEFPLTKDELHRRVGRWQVRMPGDTEVPLGPILDRVNDQRFATAEDAVRAIQRAWPEGDDAGPW